MVEWMDEMLIDCACRVVAASSLELDFWVPRNWMLLRPPDTGCAFAGHTMHSMDIPDSLAHGLSTLLEQTEKITFRYTGKAFNHCAVRS